MLEIYQNILEIVIERGKSLAINIYRNILGISNILEIIIGEKSPAGPWQSAPAKQIAPQIPVNLSPNPCHLIENIPNYFLRIISEFSPIKLLKLFSDFSF